MDEQEFAEPLTLCQLMPGPNIVGITVCVGAKLRGAIGAIGAISAVAGFILVPWTVGLTIGGIVLRYAEIAVLQNSLSGLSASAAGLLIGTGLRLLMPTADAALHCSLPVWLSPAWHSPDCRCWWCCLHWRRSASPLQVSKARESAMNSSSATLVLAAHLGVLSSISFGGFRTVLPDVHDFAVAKGWVSDHEFANFFRDTPWQRIVRRGLAPLRLGLHCRRLYYRSFCRSRVAECSDHCCCNGTDARDAAQSALNPDGRRSLGRAGPSVTAAPIGPRFRPLRGDRTT